MSEKIFRIIDEGGREEVDILPVEGLVTKSKSEARPITGSGYQLWLDIDTDPHFSYYIIGARFRVNVGERVRLYPLDPGDESFKGKSDFRRVAGMQILDDHGIEVFRYNGLDNLHEYEIMGPDTEC
jgi:hypothetical protein